MVAKVKRKRMSQGEPIKRIGVFHFGKRNTDKKPPLSELECALKDWGSALPSNSLVVLPEAFNVEGNYLSNDYHSPNVQGGLVELSRAYNVGFVAGLMDGETLDERHSNAVLIDAAVEPPTDILASKRSSDGRKYKPQRFFKPRHYRGILIAALVCIDSYNTDRTDNKEFHRLIKKRFRHSVHGPRVLCIPADLNDGGITPADIAKDWIRYFEIIAIATSPSRHSSGLFSKLGPTPATPKETGDNWIVFTSVAHCDEDRGRSQEAGPLIP